MDKNYLNLFKELAYSIESLAESLLELDNSNNDVKGIEGAQIMKKDFSELYDRLRAKDFNDTSITRNDFAKLLVSSLIMSQQIEKRIEEQQRVLKNYKNIIIPRLQRILNESKDNEEAQKIAQKIFEK